MSTATKTGESVLQLLLTKIRLDGNTQPRAELDSKWVAELAQMLKEGIDLSPVDVFFDGSHYWLSSGFHRWHAHKQAGQKYIAAKVINGTVDDAILDAVGTNHDHGKPRTSADIRHAIRMLLKNPVWRTWSNHEIARQVKIASHHVVADEKRRMAEDEAKIKAVKEAAEKAKAKAEAEKNKPKGGGKKEPEEGKIAGLDPAIPPPPPEATTTYRTKGGNVVTVETAAFNKGKKSKAIQEERDPEKRVLIQEQIDRSGVKYPKQMMQLGWSDEEMVADLRRNIAKLRAIE